MAIGIASDIQINYRVLVVPGGRWLGIASDIQINYRVLVVPGGRWL